MTTPAAWQQLVRECFAEVVAAASGVAALDAAAVSRLALDPYSNAWPGGHEGSVIHIGVDMDLALERAPQWVVPDPEGRPEWIRWMLVGMLSRYVTRAVLPGQANSRHAERGEAAVQLLAATPTGRALPEDSGIPEKVSDLHYMVDWNMPALRPRGLVKRCLHCRAGTPPSGGSGLCGDCGHVAICDECGRVFERAEMKANYCEPCAWDAGFSSHSERADVEITERESDESE